MNFLVFTSLTSKAELCLIYQNEVFCTGNSVPQTNNSNYYGDSESSEIEVIPSPKNSFFANIKNFSPSFTIKLDGDYNENLIFSRWTPFIEVNLVKKGIYTQYKEGMVADQDRKILESMTEESKEVVSLHDMFRIKDLSLAWDFLIKSNHRETQVYAIPFHVTFMFYKSNNLPNWAKSWAEIDQGSQAILGTLLIQVNPKKEAFIEIEFYDETNLAEEIGQFITEIIKSKKVAINMDKDRILKAVAPALEKQLNLQIDQLVKDLEEAEKLNDPELTKVAI